SRRSPFRIHQSKANMGFGTCSRKYRKFSHLTLQPMRQDRHQVGYRSFVEFQTLRRNRNVASTVQPAFRIDVTLNQLLRNSVSPPAVPLPRGATLPEPVFPQYPDLLNDPGPESPPEKRQWSRKHIYRSMRGWLFPYMRSRIMPGDFHPITAYLFVEYKCNL